MFADMLVYLRKREGLSQAELAKRLRIPRSTLAMYETNRREPPFEMLEAIADYFNVNIDTLMGRDTSPVSAAQDILKDDIIRLFNILSEADRQKALGYLQALADNHKS